ncbi:hypothetical protein [Sphingomonas faeni]|uniref:hypothetical protein n=1 Tax=Sphingomonas faeni TaxID=185950 RepID=UPI0027D7CB2B|nr:hypothetical protein [Sphingomonas faeni]
MALFGIDEPDPSTPLPCNLTGDPLRLSECAYRQDQPKAEEIHCRTKLVALVDWHATQDRISIAVHRAIVDGSDLFLNFSPKTHLGQEFAGQSGKAFLFEDENYLPNLFAYCHSRAS